MDTMINIGIDLGTTNSVISKYDQGNVNILKNPSGWKDSMPSAVGFRSDRILIGEKAIEYSLVEPEAVFKKFKRRMGTLEAYPIKSLNRSITPVELSAHILKKLKDFTAEAEKLKAAVITVPACFDSSQSDATKEAGYKAGFEQVILLQEPIAASLAFANKKKYEEIENKQWLVYDLGGGTFDVALIKIKDGEMKVINHEGDNYLGGANFDELIVNNIILPKLEQKYYFNNLRKEMTSAGGKYVCMYVRLLKKAEEAKIELSSESSSEFEINELHNFYDDNNKQVKENIIITRSEFNELIKELIDKTIGLIKKMLTKHNLKSSDLVYSLMVGGSTYIPFVRKRVEEALGIPINFGEIDPTTAISMGAAYYASTKRIETEKILIESKSKRIKIRAIYESATKEKETIFAARIDGDLSGLSYSITRQDGGYDSGLRILKERINEDIPLVPDSFNGFVLHIVDEKNNPVEADFDFFGINSGIITQQVVSEDVYLESDDPENIGESTKLDLIFQKNTNLPQISRPQAKTINKTVIAGKNDDVIRICVYEGPSASVKEANKLMGEIVIPGSQLTKDVIKGSDIEIMIAMNESRDLTVSAKTLHTGQEFQKIFKNTYTNVNINELRTQIDDLAQKIDDELKTAKEKEEYKKATSLNNLQREIEKEMIAIALLSNDDIMDSKYYIDSNRRKIAHTFYELTKDRVIGQIKSEYFETKIQCGNDVDKHGNEQERTFFNEIVSLEESFLNSDNSLKIKARIKELDQLRYSVLWRTPEWLTYMFNDLKDNYFSKFDDPSKARSAIESGSQAIENKNWQRLAEINGDLISLLPSSEQKVGKPKIGFN